ncbi:MAG TPA: DMT family transporter [Thiolinea sp.]|nr:DMT family transporter [Thiolinea sp.]
MTRQNRAYLSGLAAVLCWSTVATAFKLSLAWLTPAQLLLFASLSSCVVLGSILVLQGKAGQLRQLNVGALRTSLVFGALNPALYYLILFQAYDRLPAQEAQIINYTWAITMALLAVPLLKQPLRRQDIAAAILCYFGVVVIASHGNLLDIHFSDPLGVILALISTLIWALYWIFSTRDLREPVPGLFLNFLCALPLILGWCLFTGELENIRWQGVWGAVYVGVFEMGLTFVLWLNAMKLTESTARISNLIFISPLLSLAFIGLVLDEPILGSTLWGLGLIVGGLLVQQTGKP